MYIVNAKDKDGITILAVVASEYDGMCVDLEKFIFSPIGRAFKEFNIYRVEENLLYKSIAILNIVGWEYVVCTFKYGGLDTFSSNDIKEALNRI
jgi:hypothetical protein